MDRINFYNFEKHNDLYNKSIKPLVDEIFQQRDIGSIEYIMSDHDSFHENRHLISLEHDKSINPQLIKDTNTLGLSNYHALGVNEKALSIYLLESTYDIIVLSGAMGSGKSTTSRFVLDYIQDNYNCNNQPECKSCKIQNINIIRLDFNRGFSGNNPDIIIDKFLRQFYLQLKRNLKQLFDLDNKIFESFLEWILNRAHNDWEHEYEEFISDYIDNLDYEWDKKPKIKKCNTFFKWIDDQSEYSVKIDLLGYLIQFIIKQEYIKKECILIFFDNIDQLPEIAQNQIITMIFQFTEISRAKTLITIRLTSFGWIPAKASYTWGQFQHAGPTPTNIIRKRIANYLTHKSVLKRYAEIRSTISEDNLRHLDMRLELLNNILSKKESRLYRFVVSISGNSIRRGLFLMVRIFYNNAIGFDNASHNEDKLSRCFLLGTNKNCKFDPEDRLVMNIFCNPTSLLPTFIKIRILQLAFASFNKKQVLTLQNMIDDLYLFYKRLNAPELRHALNELLNDRRKMIYIDGVGKYNSEKDLFTSPDDKVNISVSGKYYIEHLIHDLVYIQESFLSIHWPIESGMPNEYDFELMVDRISVVRKGLKFLLEDDFVSMQRFISKNNKYDDVTKFFVSSNIIYQVAASINNIFKKYSVISEQLQNELLDWVDILLVTKDYNNKLCFTEDLKFEHLINNIITQYKLEIRP